MGTIQPALTHARTHVDGVRPSDHEWVSARAVAWVIHDAPVPVELFAVLTVIAARCDEHGRGSYQSVPTIAALTGRSVDQARRDIKRLVELGLLVEGDQDRVKHLPAGQRPVVYDMPLHLKGSKPVKRSKNPTGKKKAVVIHATPGMDARGEGRGNVSPVQEPKDDEAPCMDAGGGMDATPCMEAPQTPCMDATQITMLKNPLKNPLSASRTRRGTPAPPSDEREKDLPREEGTRPPAAPRTAVDEPVTAPTADVDVPGVPADLARQVMHATGATPTELARVVEAARRDGIRTPASWLRSAAGAANFRERLADVRTAPPRSVPGPRPYDRPLAEVLAAPDGIPRVRDEETGRRGAAKAREALAALRREAEQSQEPPEASAA